MRKPVLIIVLQLALLLGPSASLQAQGKSESGALLILNARIIDPETQSISAPSYLVVRDGKITERGARVPGGTDIAHRLDLGGAYLLPGLIDTHAHVTLGPVTVDMMDGAPVLGIVYDEEIIRNSARNLLAFGVTTIRNPGGDAAANVAYREAVERGEIPGPSALVAGPVIDRPIAGFEGLVDAVSEDRPIEEIVRTQAKAGVDMIKFYYMLGEEDLRRGQAAADALGLPTVAHLGVNWTEAAKIGIDAIVHVMPNSPDLLEPEAREAYQATKRPGSFEFFEWWEHADLSSPLIKEMIDTLVREQVHIDATLIAFRNAFWGDTPAVRDQYLDLAHPAFIENWTTLFRFDMGWQEEDYARARAVWPKILEFTRMLHEAGVPLTLGTDQANPYVIAGASLVQEMELHEEAGISRWDILQMATVDAANILGLGKQVGRIAPGLEADFVILKSNPLEGLDAFYDPWFVVNDGDVLRPAGLLRESGFSVR